MVPCYVAQVIELKDYKISWYFKVVPLVYYIKPLFPPSTKNTSALCFLGIVAALFACQEIKLSKSAKNESRSEVWLF
jgi:hypothetical protein